MKSRDVSVLVEKTRNSLMIGSVIFVVQVAFWSIAAEVGFYAAVCITILSAIFVAGLVIVTRFLFGKS